MALYVTVLDASRHQAFLKQQRIDPVTHKTLEPGDRVVACAHCHMVFLEGSWDAVNGRMFGHGTDTLPDIEIATEHFHFRAQRAATPEQAEATNGNGAATERVQDATTTHVPHHAPVDAPRNGRRTVATDNVPSRPARPLKLRDIPFQMREIPFGLREINEL